MVGCRCTGALVLLWNMDGSGAQLVLSDPMEYGYFLSLSFLLLFSSSSCMCLFFFFFASTSTSGY